MRVKVTQVETTLVSLNSPILGYLVCFSQNTAGFDVL